MGKGSSRNKLCSCNSGKKYKACCGKKLGIEQTIGRKPARPLPESYASGRKAFILKLLESGQVPLADIMLREDIERGARAHQLLGAIYSTLNLNPLAINHLELARNIDQSNSGISEDLRRYKRD